MKTRKRLNKEDSYYYLQYWLYFDMNDLRYFGQTSNQTWHEGDWEHVTLRLNSNLQPDYINFYNHYGGRTRTASQCWWSEVLYPSYTLAIQGWEPNVNHLHIWVAANAHALYNRYDSVYHFKAQFISVIEDYKDNVDYSSLNYDLYFEYDKLEKMGEIYTNYEISGVHNHTYYPHYEIKGGKHWIAFTGRVGNYWDKLGECTFSPDMPTFRIGMEWKDFTVNSSGFGNVEPFIKGVLNIEEFDYRIDNNPSGD